MDLSLRNIRKNIAAFTLLGILASFMVVGTANAAVATDVYGDVTGTEWYAGDVQWGLDNGILDETQAFFRAGDNATRAEFFKMTAAGAGIPEAACDETLFPDLNADHWGCGWVTALAEAGVVSGDGANAATPGYVRPNDNIVRAEAGKVVVEAYGLTGSSPGTVFDDVSGTEWYSDYAGIAYDNCVFQGVGGTMNLEGGRNIVRAEAIAVVHRGANPTSDCTTYVGPAGALTVSVDGSTPPSSLIPQNASGVLYTVWGLAASNDEDILVEGLLVKRQGLGDPGDFSEVRLYVNGVQKGSKKNINTTSNEADFALAGDAIRVPAGGKLLVGAVGDMDTLNQNSENALCLMAPASVTAVGADSGEPVDVGGSFAACGNYMYTTSARVGDVTYTTTDFGGDINVGETDVDMTRLRLEVDGEDGLIQSISMKQTGSADPQDFANTMWYYNNAPVEGLDCMWVDDYFYCDFSNADQTIPDGGVMNLDLRTDVVGGIGNTAAFDVKRDTDIFVLGGQYGYGLNVSEDVASTAPVARNIVGGRLAFATSADNPTVGDVAPNANDHEFLGFNISTAGDAVDITEFDLTVFYGGTYVAYTEVDDLKVWRWDAATESWKVAASALDPASGTCAAGACTNTYEDVISLPAAGTTTFMATMDVDSSAPNGATYQVGMDSVVAEYTVDDDPVAPADMSGLPLLGNIQTVAPPSLTLEKSSSPGDQTVVKNQKDLSLVGYDLTASTASDLVVRTLEITCVPSAGNCDDYFTNLELYQKDGGSMFFLDDSNFAGQVGVFNNVNLDVLGGQTEKVVAKADATSSPVAAVTVDFEIANDGDVAADDQFGYALSSAQKFVCMGGTADQCLRADAEAPRITFASNGKIQVSIEDTLDDEIILDGTNDVMVAEITVHETTDSEAVTLQKLRITNSVDTGACPTASGVSSVRIPYPSATTPYSAALQSVNNDAEFSFNTTGDRKITVPKSGTIKIPVYVNTNEIGAGGALSGDCVNLAVQDLDDAGATGYDADGIDIEAVGQSSGILLSNADILGGAGYLADIYDIITVAGDGAAEVFTIRNNKPSITTNFELSTGQDLYGFGQTPSTTDPILGFNLSVEGTDTMSMYDVAISQSGSCAPAATLLLYSEASYLANQPALTVADAGVVGTFEQAEFKNGVGMQVTGGSDRDYVVVGDTSACVFNTTAPDTLEAWISNFGWNDSKATVLPIPATGVTNDTINADTTLIFG